MLHMVTMCCPPFQSAFSATVLAFDRPEFTMRSLEDPRRRPVLPGEGGSDRDEERSDAGVVVPVVVSSSSRRSTLAGSSASAGDISHLNFSHTELVSTFSNSASRTWIV